MSVYDGAKDKKFQNVVSMRNQLPYLPWPCKLKDGTRCEIDFMHFGEIDASMAIFNDMLKGGGSWPFIEEEFDRKRYLGYYCGGAAFVLRTIPSSAPLDDENENESIGCSEDWDEYNNMLKMTFYTFAGYQPYAKKIGLFMYKNELKRFLEIVNVGDAVEDVFELIDTDISDGKISFNEFMDFFTKQSINDHIYKIYEHISEQITWKLLVKALKIFEKVDADHSGKLEYGEFENFGRLIGLDANETEILWHRMDTNESGSVDIIELFEWFRNRLYQQRRDGIKSKKFIISKHSRDGIVCGTFYVKPNFPGRCGHICNGGFITNSEYRGKGAATMMGRAYLRLAKDLGYRASLFNLVFVSNKASVRIWTKLGFVQTGCIPNAAKLKGIEGYVDAKQFYHDLVEYDHKMFPLDKVFEYDATLITTKDSSSASIQYWYYYAIGALVVFVSVLYLNLM